MFLLTFPSFLISKLLELHFGHFLILLIFKAQELMQYMQQPACWMSCWRKILGYAFYADEPQLVWYFYCLWKTTLLQQPISQQSESTIQADGRLGKRYLKLFSPVAKSLEEKVNHCCSITTVSSAAKWVNP